MIKIMKTGILDKKTLIGISAISIIAGVLLCILGTKVLEILFTVIGALMVVCGVVSIIYSNTIGGILSICVGVLLILGAWLFVNVLFIINGILLCISGVGSFAISLRNNDIKNLIVSILMVVLGVFFFINTEATANWIFFVIGALFIVTGIMEIILLFIPSKKGVKTVDVKDVK